MTVRSATIAVACRENGPKDVLDAHQKNVGRLDRMQIPAKRSACGISHHKRVTLCEKSASIVSRLVAPNASRA
jgi:hypothetical protein